MAFVKKTWKNRVSEFFNRYRVENVQTGAISKVYMNLDDGAVTQEGDVIDADTMNDLEDRIEEALSDVGKGSNWVGTTEAWNAKTDEEKAEYDTYDLTDDFEGHGVTNELTSGSPNVITSGGVANHLVAGNKKFYFDYQDGKYGYNTSANRGADTFNPFSIGDIVVVDSFNASSLGVAANYTFSRSIKKGLVILSASNNTSGTSYFVTVINSLSAGSYTLKNEKLNNTESSVGVKVAVYYIEDVPQNAVMNYTIRYSSVIHILEII